MCFCKYYSRKFKFKKSIHHFVIKDGLEIEFNLHDDSQKMSQAMKIIN